MLEVRASADGHRHTVNGLRIVCEWCAHRAFCQSASDGRTQRMVRYITRGARSALVAPAPALHAPRNRRNGARRGETARTPPSGAAHSMAPDSTRVTHTAQWRVDTARLDYSTGMRTLSAHCTHAKSINRIARIHSSGGGLITRRQKQHLS